MLLNLDLLGIGASSGSACTSSSRNPRTFCWPWESLTSGPRFSPDDTGRGTTEEDIDYVLSVLPPIVKKPGYVGSVDVIWEGEVRAMYNDKVMDHFFSPRNVGEIENPDGIGEMGNPVCGDIMRITIKVEDGRIQDIKFKTFGCGAAIATSSMVTEMVKGLTLDEAMAVSNKAVADALGGLPRRRCTVQTLRQMPSTRPLRTTKKRRRTSKRSHID